MSATITTGDDSVILHTLKKNGVVFNIPNTAVIKCRIVTTDHEVITEAVDQVDTTTGADWANSLIAIVFPAALTNSINDSSPSWRNGSISAKVETQVDDGGKLTWFESVTIVKGTID